MMPLIAPMWTSAPGLTITKLLTAADSTDWGNGCGHHAATRIVCVQHPSDGPRCWPCEARHERDVHDPIEERTCDGCRGVFAEIHPLLTPSRTAGVMLGCAGACPACVIQIRGIRGGVG